MIITIADGTNHLDYVRALFTEYTGSLGIDLDFQNYTDEFDHLPGKYTRPDGRLYLALADEKPAGCIALRPIDSHRCEMKRLYVKPEFRRMSIARKLMLQVIEDAREIGYQEMMLDTLASMTEALAIYKIFGFVETVPYYYNPLQNTRFLKLNLLDSERV